MMFGLIYVVMALVTAVVVAVALVSYETGGGEPDMEDWLRDSLLGMLAGMVWPLSLLVWGISKVARKVYYTSRENSNVQET